MDWHLIAVLDQWKQGLHPSGDPKQEDVFIGEGFLEQSDAFPR